MPAPTLLLTGATGLLGGQALARLLRAAPGVRALVLVRDPARWSEAALRLRLPPHRVAALRGDLRLPGLGLDAAARARLAREVRAVLHLAADIVFSRSLEEARATNVAGTRHLLEASAEWPAARRFCFVSTAFVAGRRTGAVREDDHGGEAGWVNAYERSKWEAEELVRGGARDPLILRSSTVVCDSPGGEVSQLNAVHRALRLFHAGLAPMMPGREEAPVDLVPADYVADAVARLALRDDLAGRTLHLCAGAGAIPLGELLDRTRAVWARDPAWRRRGIPRPALADLETYRLFEESVEETGDARLRNVTRALSHFVPQLALEKRFDTSGADAALGRAAPPVGDYWERVVEGLASAQWTATPTRTRLSAVGRRLSVDGQPTADSRQPGGEGPGADAFTADLVEWLNRRLAPPGRRIDADTPLFAGGLIDSLRILELLAWTERATGRRIPDAMIRMDNFHTPARIASVFAGEGEHAHR